MNHRLHSDNPVSGAAAVSAESIKETLERILNSRHFSQAPKKRRFVQLVCDYYLAGRAGELNEYLIGREVYERDDRYSPTEDPVVRVAAHDVRKRLEQYYQHEGQNDEVRLEIPIGHYAPIFKHSSPKPSEAEAAPTETLTTNESDLHASRAPGKRRRLLWTGIGLAVVALLTTVWLGQFKLRQTASTSASAEQAIYTPVWGSFFNSDDPTILVLSNPVVYVLVNRTDPQVFQQESIVLQPDQAQELVEALRRVKQSVPEHPNPPRLHLSSLDYTGVGEAIGVHRLTDLFRSQGVGLTLKQSRNLSAEDLKDRNLIMLGGVMSNIWSGKLPVKEDFFFTSSVTLGNRNPQPGEQAEYRTKFDEQTGQILEDYALITIKPAAQSKNTIMTFEGIRSVGTGAAAEFVTSKSYLAELNRRLQQVAGKNGVPRYFQALLKIGVENQVPTTISLLALHEIRTMENQTSAPPMSTSPTVAPK